MKINYQVNLTNQTPFVNLNPLSRNPRSVPLQLNKSCVFLKCMYSTHSLSSLHIPFQVFRFLDPSLKAHFRFRVDRNDTLSTDTPCKLYIYILRMRIYMRIGITDFIDHLEMKEHLFIFKAIQSPKQIK